MTVIEKLETLQINESTSFIKKKEMKFLTPLALYVCMYEFILHEHKYFKKSKLRYFEMR